MEKRYITPAEAGDMLNVKPQGVYSAIRRGQLPGVRRLPNGRILIDRVKLVTWIDSFAVAEPGPMLAPKLCGIAEEIKR